MAMSMQDPADLVATAILAACGWGLWVWAGSQGNGEAWDHDVFWSFVLPAMAALSAVAGWLRPRLSRVVGVALVVPQAIMLFTSSGLAPLALVGVLFFAIFALIFTGIATVAANFRMRMGR